MEILFGELAKTQDNPVLSNVEITDRISHADVIGAVNSTIEKKN
jgi:hypothetical protein